MPPAPPPPDKVQPLPSTVVISPGLRLGSFGVQLVDEELPRDRRALEVTVVRCDRAGLRLAHRRGGKRLARQAGHFAERHGLIVLIALAESIVAIGVGAEGLDLDAQVIAGALLGVLISAALRWAYLDVVALVAERGTRAGSPGVQTRIARDFFTLLHVLMVAGIVVLALGIKKTLGHVDERLTGGPALALCAGVSLYLLAHIAFRLRDVGTLGRQRLVAAALLLAPWPVATSVEARFALALVVGVLAVLVGFEVVCLREARSHIRTAP